MSGRANVHRAAAMVTAVGLVAGAVAAVVIALLVRFVGLAGPPSLVLAIAPAWYAILLCTTGLAIFRGSLAAAERARDLLGIGVTIALPGAVVAVLIAARLDGTSVTMAAVTTVAVVVPIILFAPIGPLRSTIELLRSRRVADGG